MIAPASTTRFGPLALPGGGYRLRLYAPAAEHVVALVDDHELAMEQHGGWFAVDAPAARARTRYAFRLGDGTIVPDPASRFQPDGVHGRSAIVDPAFAWPNDGWRGRPWHEHAIYELHVGAFTFEGTYAAAAERLDDLVALGVTAIELMPLSAFPGRRNWGYDGVLPFAPFAGYGTPDDLRRFIAAAHARGLAVLLDVVYNHFGPDGNYLYRYAPTFFTDAVHTPWGAAIDFSVPDVRAYFIENARAWLTDYRFDGLRLDATRDPRSILDVLERTAHARWRQPDRNAWSRSWSKRAQRRRLLDDATPRTGTTTHHAAHVLATGETHGYYHTPHMNRRPCWPSRSPRLRPGPEALAPPAFVNFLQNHDQIGNRALGERLTRLASPAAVRALSALFLLAPSPPLVFMGEEWGASTSFLYFCDFEPELAQAVAGGRAREHPGGPDPNLPETFAASVLRWDERAQPAHAALLRWYSELLHLRAREIAPLVADVRGRSAQIKAQGRAGFALRWPVAGGTLYADAQLADAAGRGFSRTLPGRQLFWTHVPTYADGIAPGWSVRWSRS